MTRYGMDCYGLVVEVEADSAAEAIQLAEAQTGRRVCRGRELTNYTPPKPGEYADYAAFKRLTRQMEADAERVRAERGR